MSAFVIKESVICIVECTKAKWNLVCENKCSHWLILRVISDPSGCFILHCWRQNRIKVKLCLVGGVEKWEDGKLVGGWKIERIEKFWFFLMSVWLKGWKGGNMKNVVYINWLLCLCYIKIPKGLISVKKWGYFSNLLPTSSFLLSFPPKLGGQNFVSPEWKFSTPFSFPLVFSLEPNKGKFHFLPYFPLLLFHPPYFHSN